MSVFSRLVGQAPTLAPERGTGQRRGDNSHIFIYVPSAEEIGEGEILRRIRVLYRDASLSQVVATWNRLKTEEQELFKRARPTKKYVSRFEAYKSSFLRRM